MTSGFSTVAGGVLAAYIALGVPAKHLIAGPLFSLSSASIQALFRL
jgi:CNT family concentrative nucleoside transporter